jgi:hypothetical protein
MLTEKRGHVLVVQAQSRSELPSYSGFVWEFVMHEVMIWYLYSSFYTILHRFGLMSV